MMFTRYVCCLAVLGTIRNTSALNLLEDNDDLLEHDDYYGDDVGVDDYYGDNVGLETKTLTLITGVGVKSGKIVIGFIVVTGLAASLPAAAVGVGAVGIISDLASAKKTFTNAKFSIEEGNYACGASGVTTGVLAGAGAVLLASAIIVFSGGTAIPVVAAAAGAAGTSTAVAAGAAGATLALAGAANQIAATCWCTDYQGRFDDCKKKPGATDEICLGEMKTKVKADVANKQPLDGD